MLKNVLSVSLPQIVPLFIPLFNAPTNACELFESHHVSKVPRQSTYSHLVELPQPSVNEMETNSYQTGASNVSAHSL